MEHEGELIITYGDNKEFIANPENTVLYTFLGSTALAGVQYENSEFNHVYLQIGENDDGTTAGMYLYEKYHIEIYDMVKDYIIENHYPQLLNMRHIPESDMAPWFRYKEQAETATTEAQVNDLMKDIDDFFNRETPDFLPDEF